MPVVYLTDERYPSGPPGSSGAVLIGSTRLVISAENGAPRTATFLVVASTADSETVDTMINYNECNVDHAALFDTIPVHWPEKPADEQTSTFTSPSGSYHGESNTAGGGRHLFGRTPQSGTSLKPSVALNAASCLLDCLSCSDQQTSTEVNLRNNSAMTP